MRLVRFLALGAILAACSSRPARDADPLPKPPPDACAAACGGLKRAGCWEAEPTEGGITCVEVCRSSSTERGWPLACWAASSTRAEVVACGRTRCQPPGG